MRLSYLKERISPLIVFNKNTLRNLEDNPANLDANLKYWLKKGEIIILKKGLYILRDTYNKLPADIILEYLANQLIQPSYLSLEYVLVKYQLLSEPVQVLTSITVKKTSTIKNSLGVFRYYSIQPCLFTGYSKKQKNDFIIWEAKKSKAMFDYLYLRFFRTNIISVQGIDALRINWENMSKKEFQETSSYASLIENQRIKDVLAIIKKEYYA